MQSECFYLSWMSRPRRWITSWERSWHWKRTEGENWRGVGSRLDSSRMPSKSIAMVRSYIHHIYTRGRSLSVVLFVCLLLTFCFVCVFNPPIFLVAPIPQTLIFIRDNIETLHRRFGSLHEKLQQNAQSDKFALSAAAAPTVEPPQSSIMAMHEALLSQEQDQRVMYIRSVVRRQIDEHLGSETVVMHRSHNFTAPPTPSPPSQSWFCNLLFFSSSGDRIPPFYYIATNCQSKKQMQGTNTRNKISAQNKSGSRWIHRFEK